MIGSQRQQIVFWVAALAVFFLALHLLSSILLPFVAGAVIAYFLDPAVVRLTRWGVPRWAATTIVLLIFVLVLVLLIALVVPLFRLQTTELIKRAPSLLAEGKKLVDQLMNFASQQLPPEQFDKLRDMASTSAGDAVTWGAGKIQTLLTSGLALANILSLVFITPIVAFFFLRDWDRLVAHVDSWLPRQHIDTIREQARLVDSMLGGYGRGQLLVCVVLAVYYGAALTLAGVEFGVVLGIITGILAFIPFLGFATGFVLATGLAFVQFGSFSKVLWVWGIYGVGQILESNILSPKLIGERVALHPVWIIFALLAFGTLFGFLGVLIALPAAAVAGVLVRFALGRYLASPLYDNGTRGEF